MIQAKVDTRFLGTIQNTFYGLPPLPEPVKMFFMLIAVGLALLIANYFIRKYKIYQLIKSLLNEKIHQLTGKKHAAPQVPGKDAGQRHPGKNKIWKGKTDQDILERLVMNRTQADIFGERSGQRTLAAVVNVAGIEGMNVIVTFKDMATEDLLNEGAEIKFVFEDLLKGNKKVNAFAGTVKSFSPGKGAVITRKTSFGYIKRRVYARRKVADQRYIKIKIWRLDNEDFDIDYTLDKVQPDIVIDNRRHLTSKTDKPHVVDISKGGLALVGSIREGGEMISRNDRVLLAMLIYMPAKKTFQPHLIYAETRAARSMGVNKTRMSFQFLRSLKIPPCKRSCLFKGQAVMAMQLSNPQQGQ